MEEAETPPSWQPPVTLTGRKIRQRPLLHSSLVIIIVPSLSLLFIFFVLLPSVTPRLVTHTKPNSPLNSKGVSVRKSWDSLNIVLVVFAILCGVFARRNDDVSPAPEERESRRSVSGTQRSKSERRFESGVPQWGGYVEQRIETPVMVTGVNRLRRTVSEMPPAQLDTGADRLRFFDDSDVARFYHHHLQHLYPEMNRLGSEMNWTEPAENWNEQQMKQSDEPVSDTGSAKEIPVDTSVLETRGELPSPPSPPPSAPQTSPAPETPTPTPPPPPPIRTFESVPRRPRAPHVPPPSPPPPPPIRTPESVPRRSRAPHMPPSPSPPPSRNNRPNRTFQNIPQEEREPHTPPPPPPPPPPPAPRPITSPVAHGGGWGEKKKRSARKRMNATKEIATAIASLYNHRKRKRKQKSRQNLDTENHQDPSAPSVSESPAPPPPPPPPPPPASVFHNLFKKSKIKTKSKKVHSLSSTTPTPPPPPERSAHSCRKPPLPARPSTNLFERDDTFPMSGSQSPMTPIRRPPPPMKLEREIDGEDEEREEEESFSSASARMSSVSGTGTACPSPDVNAKADTFIARHHHGWRLEKLNSWREKHSHSGGGPSDSPIF